jgi:hypothetical protein
MAKVIRLNVPQNKVVETLEELLQKARAGEINSFVFAGKTPNGDIATSWAQADVGERQELAAHIQIDIMYAVVESNMDRLGELL